jgi:hypothetical protein
MPRRESTRPIRCAGWNGLRRRRVVPSPNIHPHSVAPVRAPPSATRDCRLRGSAQSPSAIVTPTRTGSGMSASPAPVRNRTRAPPRLQGAVTGIDQRFRWPSGRGQAGRAGSGRLPQGGIHIHGNVARAEAFGQGVQQWDHSAGAPVGPSLGQTDRAAAADLEHAETSVVGLITTMEIGHAGSRRTTPAGSPQE